MKIVATLDNGVEIEGDREGVETILDLIETNDLTINSSGSSSAPALNWWEYKIHNSETQGRRVYIGDMEIPYIANCIAKIINEDTPRSHTNGTELVDLLENKEFVALLAAIAHKAHEKTS